MKIHAIQTGTVAIAPRQREGVGHGLRRRLGPLLDRGWTEPLPIYAFAIEHEEGVIVVDAGETARAAQPGYFPRWHPYYRFSVRFAIEPEQELGPQLEALGIGPGDVRWTVLTHMHTDHAGGLRHVADSEVLVSREEIASASGRRGRLLGYPNQHWPASFDPTAIDMDGAPYGPFPESRPLTQAGDVTLVPLPGHTPGHIGVVVEDGDRTVLLAGDSSYTQALMERGAVDGVAPDEAAARLTLDRIRTLTATTPTVYLVAHDPETAARLAEREVV